MKRYTFLMQNDLSDVDRVVLSMKTCVEHSLGGSALFKFEVSVAEALANLVGHANTTDPNAPIDVELYETVDAVHVEIYDPVGAAHFDIRDHAKPLNTVDPLAENGRGLGLILQCTDTVDYGPKANRMCLSFMFSKSGD